MSKDHEGGDMEPKEAALPPDEATRKIAPLLNEESPPTDTMATEALGGPSGEVYVILPEGEEGNIPVVETEVVEGEENVDLPHTDVLDTEEVASVEEAMLAAQGSIDEAPALPGSPAGAFSAPDNLDELATDLDDDALLAAQNASDVGEGSARGGEGRAELGGEEEDLFSAGRSIRSKVLLSAAALLLFGAAFFLFFPQWKGFLGIGDGSKTAFSRVPAALHREGSGEGQASGAKAALVPGVKGSQGEATATTQTRDPLLASRDAFHEKFLLAIELGYVGEVGDE